MELLAPAGNFKKLRYALVYGADAVYAAGKNYGLRSRSDNFDRTELQEAVNLAHHLRKKVYVTLNIYAHNEDLEGLPEYLIFLANCKVDALIISDPAVFSLARQFASQIPIHISTQANVTSWKSVEFWQDMGAKRIILARELSLAEIREIRERCPDIELEIFVHGAMCMSYSGRCLLSAFLNGRSANLGDCSQPCRWEYSLLEKSRPEETFSMEEDERGTYIFNSRDLNLLKRIEEIKFAGVDSIKIEGRMKSLYYVANVTRIYREGLDSLNHKATGLSDLFEELDRVSHRPYCEGFADGLNSMQTQYYGNSSYIRNYQYLGDVIGNSQGRIRIQVKGKFSLGEEIEIIFPHREKDCKFTVEEIFDEDETGISFTKPNTVVSLACGVKMPEYGIIRKKIR